MHVTKLVTIQQ